MPRKSKHAPLQPGARVGDWTVLGPVGERTAGRVLRCRCRCGKKAEVREYNLWSEKSRRCRSCASRLRPRKPGVSHTRLYSIWENMLTRCRNPRRKNAHRYALRGITVCPEWESSFIAFRDWSLAHGYSRRLQLDRRRNGEGYSPDNCRWVTPKTQGKNRDTNVRVTAFGTTKILADWERDHRCTVTSQAIRQRLRKGWTPAAAISTPPFGRPEKPRKKGERLFKAWGAEKTMAQWARDPRCRVSPSALAYRLWSQWEPERAISQPPAKGRRRKAA